MSNAKDLPISKLDQRLLACAALVRAAPEEGFDLSSWKCGTTHCAVGLYAASGIGEMTLEASQYKTSVGGTMYSPLCRTEHAKLVGWSAVDHEFGLSYRSSLFLFSPDHYSYSPSREMVARRIEQFVADRIRFGEGIALVVNNE